MDSKSDIIWKHFYPDLPLDYQTEYEDACGFDVWNCEKHIKDALAVVDKLSNTYNFHCNRNGPENWDVRFGDKEYTIDAGAGRGKTLCEAISNALMDIIENEKIRKEYEQL